MEMNNTEEIIAKINEANGFTKHNNMVITKAAVGLAEGTLRFSQETVNHYGSIHGGALFSLADYVAGVAAASYGTICLTLDASIHYFKPVTSGIVRALASETSKSNKTAMYEVCLYDEEEVLVAKAAFTYYNTEKRFDK